MVARNPPRAGTIRAFTPVFDGLRPAPTWLALLCRLHFGRIIEQGTHGALLRQNGHYAALWRRQSGGFIDAAEMQAAE